MAERQGDEGHQPQQDRLPPAPPRPGRVDVHPQRARGGRHDVGGLACDPVRRSGSGRRSARRRAGPSPGARPAPGLDRSGSRAGRPAVRAWSPATSTDCSRAPCGVSSRARADGTSAPPAAAGRGSTRHRVRSGRSPRRVSPAVASRRSSRSGSGRPSRATKPMPRSASRVRATFASAADARGHRGLDGGLQRRVHRVLAGPERPHDRSRFAADDAVGDRGAAAGQDQHATGKRSGRLVGDDGRDQVALGAQGGRGVSTRPARRRRGRRAPPRPRPRR